MDFLVHICQRRTAETGDCAQRICYEESEDRPIGRKGDSHRFGKSKMVTELYYAKLLGRKLPIGQKKLPPLAKKIVPFHHNNAPAHNFAVVTSGLYTVFTRVGPERFLFVCKAEKVTGLEEIWVDWGGYRCQKGLLYRPPVIVFFIWVEVGPLLSRHFFFLVFVFFCMWISQRIALVWPNYCEETILQLLVTKIWSICSHNAIILN